MPQRLDGGRILIGLGAVALLVSLFLDWYGEVGFDGGASAWSTFEVVDLLLALLALTALLAVLAAVIPHAALQGLPAWTLTAVGPAAFLLVVVSLLDEPPAAVDSSLETGAWIAFAASGLMAIGALLAVARISLVVTVRERGAADPGRDEPDDVPPEYSEDETSEL